MWWVKFDVVLWKLRENDVTGMSPSPVFKYSWAGDPNGVVTPSALGDLYINTTTGGAWISADGTINGWREYNWTMDA